MTPTTTPTAADELRERMAFATFHTMLGKHHDEQTISDWWFGKSGVKKTAFEIVDTILALPPLAKEIEELCSLVIQEVAELPDRTSPDDWPEAMLVTGDELERIITHTVESFVKRPQRQLHAGEDQDRLKREHQFLVENIQAAYFSAVCCYIAEVKQGNLDKASHIMFAQVSSLGGLLETINGGDLYDGQRCIECGKVLEEGEPVHCFEEGGEICQVCIPSETPYKHSKIDHAHDYQRAKQKLEDFSEEAERIYEADARQLHAGAWSGWQDISSAPRDGTSIMLFGKDISADPVTGSWCHPTACWDTSEGCFEDGETHFEDQCDGPTHWMPLPDAPTPPSEGE